MAMLHNILIVRVLIFAVLKPLKNNQKFYL